MIQMLTYVASSMIAVPFDFETSIILSIGTTILIILVASVIPNKPIGEEK